MFSLMLSAILLTACKVTYSLSGMKISPDARTVSIPYIPNNAAMVYPSLSSTVREALQDRFMRQTRLDLVNEEGDLAFEGEITGYTTSPAAVTTNGTDSGAARYRLTITVKMRFTNHLEPEYSFNDKSFSQFAEYDATRPLQAVEPTIVPEIVEMLIEDIFNAAVSQW